MCRKAEDQVFGDGVPDRKMGKVRRRHVIWNAWAKALGEKASHKKSEADVVALIRTIIFASYLITNAFIIAGVIRHWNDRKSESIGLQFLVQAHNNFELHHAAHVGDHRRRQQSQPLRKGTADVLL